MTNNVECLFICLLAIHISSLVKCLFKYFVHFLIGLFVLILSCKNSLYILDTSPLSDIGFVSVSFHSVACLFILIVSLEAQEFFILMKSNLSIFFFYELCFWYIDINI